MKVKILIDPTGPYNLSLGVGEVWDLADDLASKLIESKHAEKTKEPVLAADKRKFATLTGADGQPVTIELP